MNISELQRELRKLKKIYGDIKIKVEDTIEGYFPDYDLKEVVVKSTSEYSEDKYICMI